MAGPGLQLSSVSLLGPPLEFVLTEIQTLAQVPLGSALPAARFKAFLEKERGPRPSYRDL